MTDLPKFSIILTTYQRTDVALQTIAAIKKYLEYDLEPIWLVSDDGSPPEHTQAIREAIGPDATLDMFNANRRGVGVGMNWGLRRSWELGAEYHMILEDDWELLAPLDLATYVNLLRDEEAFGMIRMGYLSYGLQGTLVPRNKKMWWIFNQYPIYQYTYSGHASLRHKRFHDKYGMFAEGLAPGLTELDMCAKVNKRLDGPRIVWQSAWGNQGPFVHIGTQSLADIEPNT